MTASHLPRLARETDLIFHSFLQLDDELDPGIMAPIYSRVVGNDDKHSEIVWTLSTRLNGTLWETTAIPEIRTQSRELALRLLAD